MERLLVPIPECSRIIGVQRTSIYGLISAGLLQKVKIGRRTLITIESIKALVARSKVEPE